MQQQFIYWNKKFTLELAFNTFFAGVTAEALRVNIDWKLAFSLRRGQCGPKFKVEAVAH